MLAAARPRSISGPESPPLRRLSLPADHGPPRPSADAIVIHDLDSAILADVNAFDRAWMLGTWRVAWSTLPMWKVSFLVYSLWMLTAVETQCVSPPDEPYKANARRLDNVHRTCGHHVVDGDHGLGRRVLPH